MPCYRLCLSVCLCGCMAVWVGVSVGVSGIDVCVVFICRSLADVHVPGSLPLLRTGRPALPFLSLSSRSCLCCTALRSAHLPGWMYGSHAMMPCRPCVCVCCASARIFLSALPAVGECSVDLLLSVHIYRVPVCACACVCVCVRDNFDLNAGWHG